MDRREALKKLGVGSTIALGVPLALQGVAVAVTASGCLTATSDLIYADPPSSLSLSGTFTVVLHHPPGTSLTLLSIAVGTGSIIGDTLTVQPDEVEPNPFITIAIDRASGWCTSDPDESPTRWCLQLQYDTTNLPAVSEIYEGLFG